MNRTEIVPPLIMFGFAIGGSHAGCGLFPRTGRGGAELWQGPQSYQRSRGSCGYGPSSSLIKPMKRSATPPSTMPLRAKSSTLRGCSLVAADRDPRDCRMKSRPYRRLL